MQDSQIAENATAALGRDLWVPKNVTVQVRKGWLTLEGEVDWLYQLESPEPVVRRVPGVVGVSNLITVKQQQDRVDEAVESHRELRNSL